ncbi:MAG: hypothetical protein ACFFD2_29135, partial [Promethearchaeota archaeon]
MGKRTREFNLGEFPPQGVYDILVNLLKETPINPYLRDRLRMELVTHSIFSEAPFSAKIEAKTLFRSLELPQNIT